MQSNDSPREPADGQHWSTEELVAYHQHQDLSSDSDIYGPMKVEWTYSLAQHGGMSNQVKALQAREDQLGMEVGELVAGVVREEFLRCVISFALLADVLND
ncbi:hypothetical protein JCM21900_004283 [Sporobolomyces salmonicolor]